MNEQFDFEKIEDYRKSREALLRDYNAKDIYSRCKNATGVFNSFWKERTMISKSEYDNVIGFVKLRLKNDQTI